MSSIVCILCPTNPHFLASAILDRFVHHCSFVTIDGDSYRMRERIHASGAHKRGRPRKSDPTKKSGDEDIAGTVTLTMLERLCSDKEHPERYVPTFRNNYSQMKIDGAKSHGKLFEDDGENVWIWQEVKEVMMKYKCSFYAGEEQR